MTKVRTTVHALAVLALYAIAFGMARFDQTRNKFVRGDSVAPLASASRSGTGNSGWLNCEDFDLLSLTLDITVDNFTTLDVVVDTASDGAGANSRAAGNSPFPQQAGVASVRRTFHGLDRFYRVSWTMVGTSGTFSVTGDGK